MNLVAHILVALVMGTVAYYVARGLAREIRGGYDSLSARFRRSERPLTGTHSYFTRTRSGAPTHKPLSPRVPF